MQWLKTRSRGGGRTSSLVTALVVTALLGAACGGGEEEAETPTAGEVSPVTDEATDPEPDAAETTAAEDDLVAAAQEEGSVTWYAAHDPEFVELAAEAFEEEYGIPVDWVEAGSSELASRMISEAQAGNPQACVITAPMANVGALIEQELIEPYNSKHIDQIDPTIVEALGEYADLTTPSHTYLLGIVYNTDVVDEPPTSWEDLLDDRWQGQLVAPDPRYGFTYAVAVKNIVDEYGWEYFEKIGEQLRMARGGGDTLALLVTGETAVQVYSVFQIPAVAKARDDAPVEIVVPEEGALLFTAGSSLVKDCPAPNAGKLLIDFLTSEEMQVLTTEYNYYSSWPTVAPPAGVPALADINWEPAPEGALVDPAAYDELVTRFEEAIGE